MRKILLIALVGVALIAASMFPLIESRAQRAPQPNTENTPVIGGKVKRLPLPDYDVRLAGRGEFTDVDVNSTAGARTVAQKGDTTLQARSSEVDNFRASLKPEAAQNLRAEVNEAGAMKNFFIDEHLFPNRVGTLPTTTRAIS